MSEQPSTNDSHPKQSDAEPPGDSQPTNPNREIGDGGEVAADSK
jgi:hypothetical protein